MAYFNNVNASTFSPIALVASCAKDIVTSMGQIARRTLSQSQSTEALAPEEPINEELANKELVNKELGNEELPAKDFFARRQRAAQLPSVDACQFSIFTKLSVIQN